MNADKVVINLLIMSDNIKDTRAWRKILYENQPYSDNHLDNKRFLDGLHYNYKPQTKPFLLYFINSTMIIQQFTIVVMFFIIYKLLLMNKLSSIGLFIFNIISALLGISINYYIEDKTKYQKYNNVYEYIIPRIRSLFIFIVCLRTSAPILKILTSSFSDDTVYAIVLTLATAHLVFFDYSFYNISSADNINTINLTSSSSTISSILLINNSYNNTNASTSTNTSNNNISFSGGILSLNASLFASIVLISRLQDMSAIIAFCILSILFFFMLPRLVQAIKRKSIYLHILFTIIKYCIVSYFLMEFISITLFVVYQVIIILLLFFSTVWLRVMESRRRPVLDELWEEAKVS